VSIGSQRQGQGRRCLIFVPRKEKRDTRGREEKRREIRGCLAEKRRREGQEK
jgi:hypothetical protein